MGAAESYPALERARGRCRRQTASTDAHSPAFRRTAQRAPDFGKPDRRKSTEARPEPEPERGLRAIEHVHREIVCGTVRQTEPISADAADRPRRCVESMDSVTVAIEMRRRSGQRRRRDGEQAGAGGEQRSVRRRREDETRRRAQGLRRDRSDVAGDAAIRVARARRVERGLIDVGDQTGACAISSN